MNFVVKKAGKVLAQSDEGGVLPVVRILFQEKLDLSGCDVRDKVVGLAVARLLAEASISSLHGELMSEPALHHLKARAVEVSYDRLVPLIKNRRGDGLCPFESLARTIEEDDAFRRVMVQRVLEQ